MKRTIVFFIVFFFMSLNGFSQEKSQLRFNSLGLKIGWYNPSLDYWKNESEFKNSDFNGGFCYNVFGDLSIIKNALGKWNMGVWQSSVEDNIQGFGLTTWTLTGMTASFDLTYQAKQITFYRITPYIGAGGEFIYLEQKLKFENKETPSPVNGSTLIAKGLAGFEFKFSEQWAMDLEFNYKIGNYKQDFKHYEANPNDPENPLEKEITEKISLNGPMISIGLKYLF